MNVPESDMAYQDQSAHGLRLVVTTGELDTSQFSVVAQETKQFLPNVTVEAAIIGASHYVSLRHGSGEMLHEVFACVPVKSLSVLATACPLGEVAGVEDITLHQGPFTYTVRPYVAPWSEGEETLYATEATIAQLCDDPHGIGLAFTFPQGELTEAPKTLVLVQYHTKRSMFEIKTIHAYPNEALIAVTSTTVQICY